MSTQDRGFASMPKEKVQEIAAKGGHASHSNQHTEKDDSRNHSSSSKRGSGNFANRDKEEVKEMAAKGGHASHKNSEDN